MIRDKIIYGLLIAYMVFVSLFAYIVINVPDDTQAQCRQLSLVSGAPGGGAPGCPGGTLSQPGGILTGHNPGNAQIYSGICYQ